MMIFTLCNGIFTCGVMCVLARLRHTNRLLGKPHHSYFADFFASCHAIKRGRGSYLLKKRVYNTRIMLSAFRKNITGISLTSVCLEFNFKCVLNVLKSYRLCVYFYKESRC